MKNVYLAYFFTVSEWRRWKLRFSLFKDFRSEIARTPSGGTVAHFNEKDVVVSEFGLMAQTFLNDVEQKSQLLA